MYAEDPDNNFFPSPGQITRLISPSGPGIRRDSGMYEGWNVPIGSPGPSRRARPVEKNKDRTTSFDACGAAHART